MCILAVACGDESSFDLSIVLQCGSEGCKAAKWSNNLQLQLSFWPQCCASIAQAARIYIHHHTACKDLHMEYNYGCIHIYLRSNKLLYNHSKVRGSIHCHAFSLSTYYTQNASILFSCLKMACMPHVHHS